MLRAHKFAKIERSERARLLPTLLRLVLPHLFPGSYGHDYPKAFWTFLALAGTCRRFRYWNHLRRWIGWSSPLGMRELLKRHSFPVPMTGFELGPAQDRMYRYLEENNKIPTLARPQFLSRLIVNGFNQGKGVEHASNFEVDIAGIPFFDLIDCHIHSPVPSEQRSIIGFRASTFAELCLFMFAVATARPRENKEDGYIVVCAWKTVDDGVIYFKESNRLHYVKMSVLGRLQRLGLTAPDEIGFVKGSLPTTSYAFFVQLCDYGNRKNRHPVKRLEEFAHRWYPSEFFGANRFKPAYNFDILYDLDGGPCQLESHSRGPVSPLPREGVPGKKARKEP